MIYVAAALVTLVVSSNQELSEIIAQYHFVCYDPMKADQHQPKL
jgi:hypothetical protein